MFILFFLFFLVFTQPVFAESSVKITNFSADSNPEWVEITNINNNNLDLTNWIFKDRDGNIKSIGITLGVNSSQRIEYPYNGTAGWLNNNGDSILLYDDKGTLIDSLVYPTPSLTSTPTNTPTSAPTNIPTTTVTSIPTVTPTSDSTIINPTSGISLDEYMPYSSLEWIEIYNNNDKPVELRNWKIKDNSSNTKTIPDLKISPKSYQIFEFSSFLNNDTDKIILINHDNQTIGQHEYPDGKLTLERSWSLVNGSWCQAEITKNTSNASSCYSAPTPTPTPTVVNSLTPTILLTPTALPTDKNLYQLDESATASAVFTPIEESTSDLTPTVSSTPIASNLVLGQTTTAKKNYLPLTLIVFGGLLLMSPLLVDKLKKK